MVYFIFWAPEFGRLCQYTGMKILLNISLKDVDMAVCRKSELFRIWKQCQNNEDRKKYCEPKKVAKKEVYMAMDQKA